MTPRQKQVMELVCKGLKNWEIAAYMGIGISTVKDHLKYIMLELRVRNRTEAAIKYKEKQNAKVVP